MARIVAELERGATPWVKRWSATAGRNVPCNLVDGAASPIQVKDYSGISITYVFARFIPTGAPAKSGTFLVLAEQDFGSG